MNDWMPIIAVAIPCNAPKTSPSASTSTTDGRKPQSLSTISTAEPTAARPSTAPTDRSMPPIRITNVIPTAMMPISDTARTTFARLSALTNRISPSRRGEKMIAATNTASSPKTL